MAYLLYDMLSNDVNGNIDTQEQTMLFDSFPWSIKQYFKDAMKNTIQYTNNLSNFDIFGTLKKLFMVLNIGYHRIVVGIFFLDDFII